jgi:hypothetical protein
MGAFSTLLLALNPTVRLEIPSVFFLEYIAKFGTESVGNLILIY